jgi:hypothetical protein
MMNDYNEYSKLERNRINQIKRIYTKKGYTVIVQPGEKDIPDFLKGYRPDIIATSNDESVIIEVKTKASMDRSKELWDLADLIKGREGWRLELIVTNPRKPRDIEYIGKNQLNVDDFSKRLNEILSLKELNYFEASYLLAWSTLEAAIRLRIKKEDLDIYNQNVSILIKNLYSYGILDKHDFTQLENASRIRNSMIHGLKIEIVPEDIDNIVKIIKIIQG